MPRLSSRQTKPSRIERDEADADRCASPLFTWIRLLPSRMERMAGSPAEAGLLLGPPEQNGVCRCNRVCPGLCGLPIEQMCNPSSWSGRVGSAGRRGRRLPASGCRQGSPPDAPNIAAERRMDLCVCSVGIERPARHAPPRRRPSSSPLRSLAIVRGPMAPPPQLLTR